MVRAYPHPRAGRLSASPFGGRDTAPESAQAWRLKRRRGEITMDTMVEDTRLPADIDAQPLVRAAAALRPELLCRQVLRQ